MFLCDYHIHSKYSFDGDPSATPSAICEAAINNGLTNIAITDHLEANSEREGLYSPYDAKAAYEDIMQVKEHFGKKLNITYGVEIGQANQYPDVANSFLSEFPVEFVLASLHNLRGMQDFYFMDFSIISEDEIRKLYFSYLDEVLEIINSIDRVDSIGHITYPHRYIAQAGKVFDPLCFSDKLSEVFGLMISKDIALEINSSTHAKGLGFTMPQADILSLYRECGGRLITLGSDAHSPFAIGASIPYAAQLAKSVGFDSALVIRNGQKELIKL